MNQLGAHALIDAWASAELAEIRRAQWYPATAAGFGNHVSGYRELNEYSEKDYLIDRTGWTIMAIRQPVHRIAIRRYYLRGEHVPKRAYRAALQAFASTWDTWEAVHEPLNPDQNIDFSKRSA